MHTWETPQKNLKCLITSHLKINKNVCIVADNACTFFLMQQMLGDTPGLPEIAAGLSHSRRFWELFRACCTSQDLITALAHGVGTC